MTDVEKVLAQALTLPVNERAALAAELLASLDAEQDDVQAAWAAEITNRLQDAIDRPYDEEDWRVALADLRRELLTR